MTQGRRRTNSWENASVEATAMPARLRHVPLLRSVLVAVLVFLQIRCTQPPAIDWEAPAEQLYRFALPVSEPVAAFGDVTVAYEGERHRGKISLWYKADTSFVCDLQTPWGTPLASIEGTPEGGRVTVGDQVRELEFDQPISSVYYFGTYPFTFRQLARILTGTYAHVLASRSAPDSAWSGAQHRILLWDDTTREVRLRVHRRTGRLRDVCFSEEEDVPPWRLCLSRFENGRAKRMELQLDERNYFVVDYERFKNV